MLAMTTADAPYGPPDAFHVEINRRDRPTLVTVRGDLDLATAPGLERTLAEEARHGGLVVLDLRELSFIDASGLGVLLRIDAYSRGDGMELRLIPGERASHLLELCGLDHRFGLADPLLA